MIKINNIEIPFSGIIQLTEINTAVVDESTWTFPFVIPFCDELIDAIGFVHLPESYNMIGKSFKMIIEISFKHHEGMCTVTSVNEEGVEFSFIENTDFYTLANATKCTDLSPEVVSFNKNDIADTLTNPDKYPFIFAPCKTTNFGKELGLDFDNIGGVDYSIINQSKDSPLVIPFLKLNKALAMLFKNSGITLASNSLSTLKDIWVYNNLNTKWLYFGVPDNNWYAWLVSITAGDEPKATICYRYQQTGGYFGSDLAMPYNCLVSIDADGRKINTQASNLTRSAKKEGTLRHYGQFSIKNLAIDKDIVCGVEIESITLENGIDLSGYEDFTVKNYTGDFILSKEEWATWLQNLKSYSSLLITVSDTSKLTAGMMIYIDNLIETTIDQIVDEKRFRILRRELDYELDIDLAYISREKPYSKYFDFTKGGLIDNYHDWASIKVISAVSEEANVRCEYKIGLPTMPATHVLFKKCKVFHVPVQPFFKGEVNDVFEFDLTKHLPNVTANEFLKATKNAFALALNIQNRTAYLESWNYILSQVPIDISELAGVITETQLSGYDSYSLKLSGTSNELSKNIKELDSYVVGIEGSNPPSDNISNESLYKCVKDNSLYKYSSNYLANLGNWKLASYNYIATKTHTGAQNNVLSIESNSGVPLQFCHTITRLKVLSGGSVGSSFELIVGGTSIKYKYSAIPDIYQNEYDIDTQGLFETLSNILDTLKVSKELKDFEITAGVGDLAGWIILKNRNDYVPISLGSCYNISFSIVEETIDAYLPYISQPGTFSIYEKDLRPDTGVLFCRAIGFRNSVFESNYADKTPTGFDYNVPFAIEMGGENGLYEKLWKAYIDWQINHGKTIKSQIDYTEEIYASGNWLRLFKIKGNAYIVKKIEESLDFGQNKLIFGDSELIKI